MIEPRIIKCFCCGKRETEPEYTAGFIGWMGMDIEFIDDESGKKERPHLCPSCKAETLTFIENMKNKERASNGLD